MRRALEFQAVPLKGPAHRLSQTHYLLAQVLGQQLERYQGHTGGTDLSGTRVRAGRAAFYQTEVLAEAIVPFLSPSPSTGRQKPFLSLHQPDYHYSLTLVILRLCPTQLVGAPTLFPLTLP